MNQECVVRTIRDAYVGTVAFDENPQRLNFDRTADGFQIHFPIKVSFKRVSKGMPLPVIANLRGMILAGGGTGGKVIRLGVMRHTGHIKGAMGEGQEYVRDEKLTWAASFGELAVYEKLREGGEPKFEIDFEGDLYFLIPGLVEGHMLRSQTECFFGRNGNLSVSYRKELWASLLRELGVAEIVLVEIPLPGHVSPEWDEVLKALSEARRSFEQGGSTGWNGCVRSARLALETWERIQPAELGPGGPTANHAERNARTKEQRIDALRYFLYQFAHLGAHTHADEWTRDDAMLMLATLSALIAETKP